jgi:homoserine dehydrogenase
MHLDLALLGFGNVGQELAELLLRKRIELEADFGLTWRVVGISARSKGTALDPAGIDLEAALSAVAGGGTLAGLHQGPPLADTGAFIAACPAAVFFEMTTTNPQDGQPATDHVRAALGKGAHVVSANKGPVAFAHRELLALARLKRVGFFFESTVMDGAPVLGVGREGLPASHIRRIRGVFNSTTNYILTRMERDRLGFEDAVRAAQEIGVAEADPTLDVDGWDSAIKTVILANVLMGADLRPKDAAPVGIRDVTVDDVHAALAEGARIRLVCEAARGEDGTVRASVAPQRVPLEDPLASVMGTSSLVDFEADTLRRLTLIEHDPGPDTTAYGLLVDMLNIARGRHLV